MEKERVWFDQCHEQYLILRCHMERQSKHWEMTQKTDTETLENESITSNKSVHEFI